MLVLRRFFIVGIAVALVWARCGEAAAQQDLFVSAAGANAVMRFDGVTGQSLGFFVTPGSGGSGDPQGIAFGPDGNLYVASNGSNNILRYNGTTGAFIDVFVTPGMSWPAEINFRGNHLYVSDFGGARVARYDAGTGAFVDNFATGIVGADGQSWDANGEFYVSSWGDNTIKRINGATGGFLGNYVVSGLGGLNGPLDNLFLPDGTFLVSSFNNSLIKHYAANGAFLGSPLSIPAPQGLELGPDGLLYAGSFGQGVINRYDPATLQFRGIFATTGGASTTNNFVYGPSTIPEPAAGLALLALASGFAALRRLRAA
jgi:DNA-binding beta-propeller fold protein YncE